MRAGTPARGPGAASHRAYTPSGRTARGAGPLRCGRAQRALAAPPARPRSAPRRPAGRSPIEVPGARPAASRTSPSAPLPLMCLPRRPRHRRPDAPHPCGAPTRPRSPRPGAGRACATAQPARRRHTRPSCHAPPRHGRATPAASSTRSSAWAHGRASADPRPAAAALRHAAGSFDAHADERGPRDFRRLRMPSRVPAAGPQARHGPPRDGEGRGSCACLDCLPQLRVRATKSDAARPSTY